MLFSKTVELIKNQSELQRESPKTEVESIASEVKTNTSTESPNSKQPGKTEHQTHFPTQFVWHS